MVIQPETLGWFAALALVGCGSSGSTAAEADVAGDNTVEVEAADDVYFGRQGLVLATDEDAGLFANDGPEVSGTILVDADGMSGRGALVQVNADGSFVYTPPPTLWGPDRFGYTIASEAGKTSSAVVTVHVGPVAVDLSLVRLGSGGFAIEGVGEGPGVGEQLRGAGDVNGDGLADIIIGNPFADSPGADAGAAYVVFGKGDGGIVDLAALEGEGAGFVIAGAQPGDAAGVSVSSAGDVNGDGLADMIVGAPLAGPGAAYVVFGSREPSSVSFSALAGRGFAILGAAPGDRVGQSVAAAGDINGDGLGDVVVGAPFASPQGSASGRTYVVYGKIDDTAVDVAELGSRGFAIDGAFAGEWSGSSVTGGADVNGDGVPDVAVGAPLGDGGAPGSGRTDVVFGGTDRERVELGALLGDGFAVLGNAKDARVGSSVALVGDTDGDGYADLVVAGAAFAEGPTGDVFGPYLVFGKPGGEAVQLDRPGEGFARIGDMQRDRRGQQVAGAGDVNGDGLYDVLVATPYADLGASTGAVQVVYGSANREGPSHGTSSSRSFSLVGGVAHALVGRAIGAAGDVDGDGIDDVLVAAHQAEGLDAGVDRVFVVFGVRTVPQ